MRSSAIAVALALISACAPCGDGEAVTACVECGPGALKHGRALGTDVQAAASPTGRVVRTCGACDHLAWLAPDFSVAHKTEVETRNSDGEVMHLAVNASNEVAAVLLSLAEVAEIYESELAVYDAKGAQRWRKLFNGNTDRYEVPFVAIGPRRVFTADPFGPPEAFDLGTGERLWTLEHGNLIAADPTGGLLVGGGFMGTLELGGTAPALTAPNYGAYVAKFEDDGVARWAVALTGTSYVRIFDVAAGPGGEIALVGSWFGQEATLAGTTLMSVEGRSNLFVALFDSDGALRFAHPLGPDYFQGSDTRHVTVLSVVTDGNEAIVAGSFVNRALQFDSEARMPLDQDGFVASFDATGLTWLRIATGRGNQDARFDALSDRIVGAFYSGYELRVGDVDVDVSGVTLAELAR